MNTSNFKWLGSNVLYSKNKQIFHITLDYDIFTLVSEEDPTCTVRVGMLYLHVLYSVHTYMYISLTCVSYPAMYTCVLTYTIGIYLPKYIYTRVYYRYIRRMHRRDPSIIITHRGILLTYKIT